MNKICVLIAPILLVAMLTTSHAQSNSQAASDPVSQGVQLFRAGKDKEAIEVLKQASKSQKNNPDLWHFLGLAQSRTNQTKEAIKSFQKAIKLRPNFALSRISLAVLLLRADKLKEAAKEAEQALMLDPKSQDANYVVAEARLRNGNPEESLKAIDEALKLDKNFREAWLLKSRVWLGVFRKETMAHYGKAESNMPNNQIYDRYRLLSEAADSLEMYLKLTQNPAEIEFWREQSEAMRFYAKWGEEKREASLPSSSQPESIKASLRPTITYRERALYTQAAREAGIQGMVLILVTYSAEGELKHILVIKGLDNGLTQSAVAAARKIKFTPAMKDGRPVSVVGQIEFNFTLY